MLEQFHPRDNILSGKNPRHQSDRLLPFLIIYLFDILVSIFSYSFAAVEWCWLVMKGREKKRKEKKRKEKKRKEKKEKKRKEKKLEVSKAEGTREKFTFLINTP